MNQIYRRSKLSYFLGSEEKSKSHGNWFELYISTMNSLGYQFKVGEKQVYTEVRHAFSINPSFFVEFGYEGRLSNWSLVFGYNFN